MFSLRNAAIQSMHARCERQEQQKCRQHLELTDPQTRFIRKANETAIPYLVLNRLEPRRDYHVRFRLHDPTGNMLSMMTIPLHTPADIRPDVSMTFSYPIEVALLHAGRWQVDIAVNDQAVEMLSFDVAPPVAEENASERASFVNRIGMEFVFIPAGAFQMGSNDINDAVKPVHKVTISRPFYLGKYEVTRA